MTDSDPWETAIPSSNRKRSCRGENQKLAEAALIDLADKT